VAGGWYLVRRELIASRLRVVAIAIAVAIVSTVVIATAAGARRTASVYERFLEHNRVSTNGVIIDGLTNSQIEAVRTLPEVDGSAIVYRFPGRMQIGGRLGSAELLLSGGPRVGLDVDRFTFLSGRAAKSADEIVIDSQTAEQTGFRAGTRVTFAPYDTSAGGSGTSPPTLAPEHLVVTGVVATPAALAQLPGRFAGFTSPRYHDGTAEGASFVGLQVRLRDGVKSLGRFQASLAELRRRDPSLPPGVAAVDTSGDSAADVQAALDALAIALLIICGGVLLQGAVTLATVLTRSTRARAADSQRLAAMGATRGQRIVGLVAAPVLVALPAIGLGAVAAWIVSDWFPVSSARELETAPGRAADWVATAAGVGFLVALLLAIAAVAAWRGSAPSARRDETPVRAKRAARLPFGSPAGTGARFAFDRRGARTPIRTASAGLVVGVAGVIAVLGVISALHRVERTPARYGWNWDVAVNATLTNRDLQRAGVSGDVRAAAIVRGSIVDLPFGATWAFDTIPLRGAIDFTVVDGRLPVTSGELAAGPVWLRDHDLAVGDVVPAACGASPMTVVGAALVPAFDDDAIGGTVIVHDPKPSPLVQPVVRTALRLRPGASRSAVVAKLERALPAGSVDPRALPLVPPEIRNLLRTVALLRILALLLALSAAAALAHLLASAIRQRRKEIATLRTLGFTPRQAGVALLWAALSATALGVVIGAPIGVVAGFTAWRIIAGRVGIATGTTIPWSAVLLVAVASAVVATLVSWLPAARAARLEPAATLRGE
jgi:hypothetical protein